MERRNEVDQGTEAGKKIKNTLSEESLYGQNTF
jgi:hypothetical protein